jgi:vacuolar-type H+-ATPase subunit I/STV1
MMNEAIHLLALAYILGFCATLIALVFRARGPVSKEAWILTAMWPVWLVMMLILAVLGAVAHWSHGG